MTQFFIEYTPVAPPDARWARVTIMCRHHPEQIIGQWSTFDGEQVLVALEEGSRREHVGNWTLDNVPGGPGGALARVMTPAVAAPGPVDTPHERIRMRCGRSSCTYRPEMRSEHSDRLRELVLTLWDQGVAELIIDDLDAAGTCE